MSRAMFRIYGARLLGMFGRRVSEAKITTRGVSEGQRWQPGVPSKISQHALHASRTCHPPSEILDKSDVHSRRNPSLTRRVVMGGDASLLSPFLRILLSLFLLAILLAHPSHAQSTSTEQPTNTLTSQSSEEGWSMSVRVTPASPRLSDSFQLEVLLKGNEDLVFESPELLDVAEHFEILRNEPVVHAEKPSDPSSRNTQELMFRYLLAPRTSGKLPLPTVAVPFHRTSGGIVTYGVASTPDLELPVQSQFSDESAELNQLSPMLPPMDLKTGASWKLIAAVTLLLASVVSFLAWCLLRKPRSQTEPVRTPEEIATSELQTISSVLPADDEEHKEFFVRVTRVVRRYVEQKTGIPAPALTTEEFMKQIDSNPHVSEEVASQLREFLESADLIKYAGKRSNLEDVHRSIAMARELIQPQHWGDPTHRCEHKASGSFGQCVSEARKSQPVA